MSNANQAQIDYWNGRAGQKWAALQAELDQMLAQATQELAARAGSLADLRVLDIGCGTGETCTIWLAGGAEVTGLDISAPMLAVARERTAGRANLLQADASVWRGDRAFDLSVSRFGVMFFADPAAAFATIAANLRPDGRLLFLCWRAAAENPWATVPMQAVRDLLPEAAPPEPFAPGPFAFADRERLAGILAQAGLAEVSISPFDFSAQISGGGLEEAVNFTLQVGPVGAALAEADQATRELAAERLARALAPHMQAGRVSLEGAVWVVEARRPA